MFFFFFLPFFSFLINNHNKTLEMIGNKQTMRLSEIRIGCGAIQEDMQFSVDCGLTLPSAHVHTERCPAQTHQAVRVLPQDRSGFDP
jgi:hypothetical protein